MRRRCVAIPAQIALLYIRNVTAARRDDAPFRRAFAGVEAAQWSVRGRERSAGPRRRMLEPGFSPPPTHSSASDTGFYLLDSRHYVPPGLRAIEVAMKRQLYAAAFALSLAAVGGAPAKVYDPSRGRADHGGAAIRPAGRLDALGRICSWPGAGALGEQIGGDRERQRRRLAPSGSRPRSRSCGRAWGAGRRASGTRRSHVIDAATQTLPYDVVKDLWPASWPACGHATRGRGARGRPPATLAEMIAWMKANPEKVMVGTVGVGGGIRPPASPPSISKKPTGTNFQLVPYLCGAPLVQGSGLPADIDPTFGQAGELPGACAPACRPSRPMRCSPSSAGGCRCCMF